MHIAKQTLQLIKNSTWMVLGIACAMTALVLWGMQLKTPKIEEVHFEETQAQLAARPVQTEAIGINQNLGSFSSEVPAMNMTQRETVSGEHAAEFRGSKFIADNQKAWTLQLMKVSEEDIIRSYLDKREDRKNFSYLRLQDEQNPEQYVLLYGVYKNVQQAMEQSQKMNFELPESVKILPEKISTYRHQVNDLGSDEVASGAKLYTVVLSKAALPKVVDLSIKTPSIDVDMLAGSRITVQRKDQSGEIKSIQTETSTVATKNEPTRPQNEAPTLHAPKTPPKESQVIDPF